MVVQQHTTVQFLNSDNVQHNVFWPSVAGDKKAAKNLGTWPKGKSGRSHSTKRASLDWSKSYYTMDSVFSLCSFAFF